MADFYSRRESILEKADLDKIQASREAFLALIKPFDERHTRPFVDEQWVTAEFMNDYFVEDHNFTVIRKLMTLNNEEYCLVSWAYPLPNVVYYKMPTTVNINYLRELVSEDSERYADWAFLSASKTWSALSFYDGSELFVGYEQNFSTRLHESVKRNPDFVRFLCSI